MVPVYVCARLCLHANTKKLIMRLFPQLHVVSQARLSLIDGQPHILLIMNRN